MEDFQNLEDFVKLAYNDQLELNTKHIEELMDKIDEQSLQIYKDVLAGKYEIRKGKDWKPEPMNNRMIVKNAEVFEKVVPFFISFSKRYSCEDVVKIFNACRNKNNTFNFAAIGRIRTLVNLMYNDKNDRLDLPIKEFMQAAYNFSDLGSAKKSEIIDFCNEFAESYARKESKGNLVINYSLVMMDKLKDKFYKLFRCLINVGKPKKKDGNRCSMERVELLWDEKKDPMNTNLNEHAFSLCKLLGIDTIGEETIDGGGMVDSSDDVI
jgi:hypothetical protein